MSVTIFYLMKFIEIQILVDNLINVERLLQSLSLTLISLRE